MRAFTAVSSHRLLLALALLAPALLLLALLRSNAVETTAARHDRAERMLAAARGEMAALVGRDRRVLAQAAARARVRAASTKPAAGASGPSHPEPPVGQRPGHALAAIAALFVTDPAGTLWAAPAGAGGSVRQAGFFRRIRRGAALASGRHCPVPALAPSFVLAIPLAPPAAPGVPGVAGSGFRGAIGACIAPRALRQAWRGRLRPGESLTLRDLATGHRLLRVARGPAMPGATAMTAVVPGTGIAIAFAPAAAGGLIWRLGAVRDALLALGLGLGLAFGLAVREAGRGQARAVQALAGAERFADVLRLSADRYRQFYLGAPAAIQALDPAWRIIAVSDRWLTLLGYRRDEVLGRRFDAFLAPAARASAEQDWTRLLAGDDLAPTRRRLLCQDGRSLDLVMTEVAEREPDGRLRRALAVLHDPAGATPARTSERPDLLERVAGGIAHDFNNLLMVVMGSLERLAAQADRPDTVRRLAAMALSAAERGAGLTQRLLAAAGRQPLRPEVVNANRLLREAGAAIEQAAGAKVQVQFLLSPVLDPARLDPEQFRAAVLALVANAREAMPRGGRLTIETANRAGPTAREGRIAVSLADTGIGMDAAVLARATEPFFTTRPPGKASGLGLSMAEGFARQSGGSLELESEPGVGSTVRLLLPRSADGEAPAPPGASEPTGQRAPGVSLPGKPG